MYWYIYNLSASSRTEGCLQYRLPIQLVIPHGTVTNSSKSTHRDVKRRRGKSSLTYEKGYYHLQVIVKPLTFWPVVSYAKSRFGEARPIKCGWQSSFLLVAAKSVARECLAWSVLIGICLAKREVWNVKKQVKKVMVNAIACKR